MRPASDSLGSPSGIAELTRYSFFEASHRYWCDGWGEAENHARFGRCTSRFGHGHNYTLAVTVRGEINAASGMILNLHDLDLLIAQLTRQFDHQYLNESVPSFRAGTQPTAEALARYCYHELGASLRARFPEASADICHVAINEGELLRGWCAASGEMSPSAQANQEDFVNERIGLTRTYTFSAAHRLHEPTLSDAENQLLFGKCNNPHGHGHDYRLDVTVSGPLDSQTSMVVDLACLDEVVQSEVLARLDHRHLNHEVPPFDRLNPTSENLLRVVWDWLDSACPASLVELALYETPRNRFTLRRGCA